MGEKFISKSKKEKIRQEDKYMNKKINSFIQLIEENAGIGQKETLAKIVQEYFNLEKKGAVLYCKDFAVRFCSTKKKSL